MTDETIVAVYDTAAHAEAAVSDLKAANVPADSISQHAGTGAGTTTSTATQSAIASPPREEGFWASLFGGEPDHDTAVYDRSLQSGSTVVTVKTPEEHVTRVTEILERHNPIDIDERAVGYGLSQSTSTSQRPVAPAMPVRPDIVGSTAATQGGSLQLSEEQLSIGKRAVNRGTTRIRRFVVETPVEEQVTLRTEKVTLDRRPVTDGRPVTGADFGDKTIEMSETSEEAVVSKTARVKEEVSLRKEATERVETVRDTVRREDVEIEQVPSEKVTTSTTPGTPVPPVPPKR